MIYIMDVYHIKGIYLLAKDLAYNVALDQTEQLTKGIQQLTKKNMHDVSNAINILDTTKGVDKAICKTGTNSAGSNAASEDTDGKCVTKNSVTGSSFEKVMSSANAITGFTDTDKLSVVPKTSATISKDITALNREQHGVVSSAFAKAHEGV